MKILYTKTKLRKYPIYIQSNITKSFIKLLEKSFKDFNKIVLITNDKIFGIYGKNLNHYLDRNNINYETIIIRDGEKYKTLESANYIYEKLIEYNIHRNDIIVAFGGGVIGDLAGFVASTFHRGLRLIQYPTTIIGQVDSSIGGKVVVNYKNIKNVIGTFYQPHIVIIDPILLTTLKESQIINGLAEIVKYGIIFDSKILKILNKNTDSKKEKRLIDLVNSSVMEEIIHRCCYLKSKVVEKDEFDIGYRNLLNFGHTIGHCIENSAELEYINHGQAVSMGMLVAIDISIELGLIEKKIKDETIKLYKKLKLPYIIPDLEINKIMNALKYDKKFTFTRNKFILLKGINKPVFYYNISNDIIIKSINNNMLKNI